MSYDIRLERIYTPPGAADGARVLTDRLWPRGKRKEDVNFTEWYKDASPSPNLRQDWHKQVIDDATFAALYRKELKASPEVLLPLMRYARKGRLTLLSASHDLEHSHLPVLKNVLLKALKKEDDAGRDSTSSPTCYG